MDKKRLNNEIILCRPAVRKARVAVIRKIIKKMKILKACKVDVVKEKKLRKCEKLFKKIQIMKKVKDDDVTKFALVNKDLKAFLGGPEFNLRLNALACLAKHEAVMMKINSIRQLIPNWETELPLLLNSLGKNQKKNLDNKTERTKTDIKRVKSNGKVSNKNEIIKTQKKVKKKEVILKKVEPVERKPEIKYNRREGFESERSKENDICLSENINKNTVVIEKVDDPFFIEKKVIVPKLIIESLPDEKNISKLKNLKKPWIKKETNSSVFHIRQSKTKNDSYKLTTCKLTPEHKEEKLHPSWTAKKIKLIKPFEGKKIKFSDN